LNISQAELSVCESAGSFLQSSMWGEFKSRFGWSARAFLVELSENEEKKTFPLLVLCRKLLPGFSFAYVPWGPELPENIAQNEKEKAASEIAKKIKPHLSRNNVFIRFEPPWHVNNEQVTDNKEKKNSFLSAGFKAAAATVQPPDTVIINLKDGSEEILSQMKSKWRYNISLAEKKGVSVKTCGIEEIETFYNLLKETALRDGIAVHGINYYKTLFELCGDKIKLYTALHEGETLAAIVVLFRGKDATYLYGASSNNKRNLMAPYALQWKAMQDAKKMGCINYDLFGIPPNEDPEHPMAGLYRFKTGFGGKIIHRSGTWDFAYNGIFYSLFCLAEKLRKKIFFSKKKR